MAFLSRFFRTALGLLVVLGSPSGTSAQAPVVVSGPPVTAPVTPKMPAAPAPATVAPATVVAPPSGESTQGAMQIADLLASLTRFDHDGRVAAQKIGFEVPERAVNEYLAYSLRNRPRPGISAITVTMMPKNDISVAIGIDFSSVKQWAPELLPEPLRALLTGKQTLQMNAHFESKNGTFTLTVKDVHGPDGKPLASKVMNDLLQSLGSHQPESYDSSRPISLPFGLKRVWTDKQEILGET